MQNVSSKILLSEMASQKVFFYWNTVFYCRCRSHHLLSSMPVSALKNKNVYSAKFLCYSIKFCCDLKILTNERLSKSMLNITKPFSVKRIEFSYHLFNTNFDETKLNSFTKFSGIASFLILIQQMPHFTFVLAQIITLCMSTYIYSHV